MNYKKKIPKAAILTWCYNGEINYGQIFQCYAMQAMVKKLGYNPKVVRYRKLGKENGLLKKSGWFIELYELWYRLIKVEGKVDIRILRFISFIKKNITLSKQCYTKEQVEKECKDCDILFCGSDQIWNPVLFDDIYYLNFGGPGQKRIAYAPSGIWQENRKSEEFYKKIKKYIDRFDIVTVREEESAKILKKYIEREIRVVPDPTLLLDQNEWDKLSAIENAEESYIFCYFLGRFRPYRTLLKKIMTSHNSEKIYFTTPGYFEETNKLNQDEIFCSRDDIGPAEFLSMIRGAKAVCTDSYHGLIFSIIYNKQFYIFDRNTPYVHPGANMSRQESLLKKVGIYEKRRIRCKKDLENMDSIDYDDIDLEKLWPETKKLMEEFILK